MVKYVLHSHRLARLAHIMKKSTTRVVQASGFLSDGITYPFGGVSGFRPNSTLYDPNLKPQNTSNWELGLELKFLENRIGLDYTYSDPDATDQIFSVPMAGSTGYGSFVTNAGEMRSMAHELVFYVSPVRTKTLTGQ